MHIHFSRLQLRLSILFCAVPFLLHGQNLQPDFQHLDIDDGLSDYTIYCFAQDADGFMWFGTRNGLGRYDGYSIKTYYNDPTHSNSLPGNVIYALHCDKQNVLWVGVDNGLCRFDKRTESFTPIPFEDQINEPVSIHAMCETSAGDIWVGTDHGVFLYNTEVGKLILLKTSPEDKTISSNIIDIACDAHDRIFYTGYFGLGMIDLKNGKHIQYADSIPFGKSIRNIACGSDRSIWCSTNTGILWQPDKKNDPTQVFLCSAFYPGMVWDIRHIATDDQNRIWISDFTNGLFVADPVHHSMQRFTYDPYIPNSLKNNSVLGLFISHDHSVWLSEGGAVTHFSLNAKPFHYVGHDPSASVSLTDNWVRTFCTDDQGDIWASTANGISIFDPGTNSIRKNIQYDSVYHKTLPGASVRALVTDAAHNIWIGGSGGIVSYDQKNGTFRKHMIERPEKCSANPTFTWTLLVTQKGDVYAGTGCGLFVYDRSLDHFLPMDKVLHTQQYNTDAVRTLFQSADSKIWIAYGKHAMVFDPETHACKVLEDIVHCDVINAFAEDASHNIWMSARNGLFKYDPQNGSVKQYTTQDGLPNVFCGGILIDRDEHVWVTNGAGLSVLDVKNNIWHTFAKSDGLFCLPFNDQPAFSDADGTFYFAGREGLIYFDPEEIKLDLRAPHVLCEQFSLLDTTLCKDYIWYGTPSLDLPHNKNFISFQLTAISYEHSEKNTYAYFLEGFDTKWNYSDTRRFATYTDLPPGKYVLHTKAANQDGIWSEEMTLMQVHIRLPYWQTWWFIVLTVCLAGTTLYLAYRARIQHILALEKVRNRIARDLHDDIGASLSSIRLYSESVKRKLSNEQTESGFVLDKIAANAKEVVENMGIIVWAINPVNDSLKNLVQKLNTYAAEMCAIQNMELDFPIEPVPDLKLSMEVRKNIFLILREAIHNAVKYSGSKTLHIEIKRLDRKLHCIVADAGKGMDISNTGTGNGLQNMRTRALEIRAEVDWISAPGAGTIVNLRMDIP